MSYLTGLVCTRCGKRERTNRVVHLCTCGAPFFCEYDLAAAEKAGRAELLTSGHGMWRYQALMPVEDPRNRVMLGEGQTPLLPVPRLGSRIGLRRLYIKDEGLNPTASFKARGLSAAVSKAKELGVSTVAIPSAGNAAGAMAAYAAAAGLRAFVAMPRDVPAVFLTECRAYGAEVELVDGLITDCGRRVSEYCRETGAVDLSTLKEPYRVEGKKTMGYELAEQFGWHLPDVVIYPTGGGTGLIGMWKAFAEMAALGWIDDHRPRMVTVQAEGCAPIVRAFHEGAERAEPWQNARTVAAGLRVPRAVGDFLMLRALRESAGTAVAVSDEEILEAAREVAAHTGIFPAPEGAATWAGLKRLVAQMQVGADERVVLFNTGSGLKYAEVFNAAPSSAQG